MAARGRRIPLRPDDPWADVAWPFARWDTTDLIVVGLAPFGAVLVLEIVLAGLVGWFGPVAGLLVTACQQLALGLGIAWWVRTRYGALAPLGLRRRTWSRADVGAGIGMGVVAVFAGGFTVVVTQSIVEAVTGESAPLPRDVLREFGEPWAPAAMLLALVLAPWCEEIFFRGFLFGGLRRRWRFRWAALASGLAFALAHADAIRIPGLVVMGMLLAFVYERRRTLVASMAAHATVNLIAVVAALSALR